MFACPHCRKTIEIGPQKSVPWWRYDPGGPTVGLGCGSLIIIAIIVSAFSRGDDEADAIRALRKDVQALEEKMDVVGESVKALSASDNVSQ